MSSSNHPPTVRRMKTYTGTTGYVYQYYFVGKRTALENDPDAPATEFIFDITPDRKTMYGTSVFLKQEGLDVWAGQHGRLLTDPEQYAAAKLRLFQAFDVVENIREHLRLVIDGGNIEAVLSSLDLG
ncbi:MAG: hypothetical protein LAN37_05715 [Acidobacteriia bacterium]|nr:hypothetical protein [Terriglobia bacterium]